MCTQFVLISSVGNLDCHSSSDLGTNLLRKALSGILDGLPDLQIL